MELRILWYQTVAALRPACARTRTFLGWLVVLAAMTVRTVLAGVTSLVRSHWLRPRCYHRLLDFFHSPARYRAPVRRKLTADERHIQISLIVQGLCQYLAVFHPRAVWRFFGSWLRTTHRNAAPAARVVAHALRNSLPDFLLTLPASDALKKFLAPKLAPERCPHLLLVGGGTARRLSAKSSLSWAGRSFDSLPGNRELVPDEAGDLPDRSRGDAESALAAAARVLRASPRPAGTSPERDRAILSRRQARDLLAWAATSDRLTAPGSYRPLLEEGGQEHRVWLDESSQRYCKATFPGRFGFAVAALPGLGLELVAGTPLEYVERWRLQNSLFGDDARLEGIAEEQPDWSC
jgi:hypothetical protein